MNRPLLALLTLTVALAGCTTLNHRDRNFLESSGVTRPVYDKMMHHEPLTLDDIITLTRKGIPGAFIVHYLRPTYFVYKLSANDAARLRQAGVAEGVIRYLATTPALYSPASVPVWLEDEPHFNDPNWEYRRY